jgi:DNA excision repair protein ERCC-4
MHVVVDDREPADVAACLRGLEGVTVSMARLRAGDYVVDRRVWFERKTFQDFAQSLVDGRLFEQAGRLRSGGGRAVYVLEGTSRDLANVGVSREALQGALITLQVVLDIPVLRSLSVAETARLIVYTGRQLQRQAAGAYQRPGYRPKGRRARQLYILQGLPGVGPTRAARLLDTFGNVESVFIADEEELAGVAGLGARTAAAIRSVVKEARAPYLAGPDV